MISSYKFNLKGQELTEPNYKEFFKENVSFVGDFIKSCNDFLGKDRLKIENIDKI